MIPTSTCLTTEDHFKALLMVEYKTIEEKYTGTLSLLCHLPNDQKSCKTINIVISDGEICDLDTILANTEGMVYKRVNTNDGHLHTIITPDIPILMI